MSRNTSNFELLASPLIRGRDVTLAVGVPGSQRVVLEGANFEIWPGDRISLSGASGSGKSTLLHLIGGLIGPTHGVVTWPALTDFSQLRPTFVSMALQGPSLLAPLTALENVALPLLIQNIDDSAARELARAMLERFGLDEVANKLPEEMSGGQCQRVSVARALVGRPQVVIADEPTGQCDRSTAAQMLDILDDVTRDLNCALVIASHDRELISRMPLQWSIVNNQLMRSPS